MANRDESGYDVVIVGGGAAGLNAALMLARARRDVLVIDGGEPRNAPAGHVHGFLTRDGTPPGELLAEARREIVGYGAEILDVAVREAERSPGGFRVALDDGRVVHARRLLLATGLLDELPDVPGLAERWGRDVLHCPYCHGWEVRDEPIAVLASGPMSVHQAKLFRQWSERITLLLNGTDVPGADDAAQLAARGVEVVAEPVERLEIADDRLRGVRLRDGRLVEVSAVAVAPRMVARSELAAQLGLQPEPHPAGSYLPAGQGGRTAVPGLWVAGNATDLKATVVAAAASGAEAGAMLNADLVDEDAERAAAGVFSAEVENRTCELVMGDSRHGLREGRTGVDSEIWDELYREREQVFSGNVNSVLAEEVGAMSPGQALDLGCGEGADAIWLARQGWRVTALDISQVALERAREAAAESAPEVVDRISWVRADLAECAPPAASFDLVNAQYLPLKRECGEGQLRAVLASVAVGGVLLFVAHDPRDIPEDHGFDPADYYLAEDVKGALGQDWEIEFDGLRERTYTGPPGAHHVNDVILRVRRLR